MSFLTDRVSSKSGNACLSSVIDYENCAFVNIAVNMPGRVSTQKRALVDNANSHNPPKSPPSAKKRKLNGNVPNGSFNSSQGMSNSFKNKMASSQPKSHFETEVLEKMTQDISGLKNHNAEKDQQWDRPSLGDFNAKTDSLRFQCIDVEEGTLAGGKVAFKMFGVSEVSDLAIYSVYKLTCV